MNTIIEGLTSAGDSFCCLRKKVRANICNGSLLCEWCQVLHVIVQMEQEQNEPESRAERRSCHTWAVCVMSEPYRFIWEILSMHVPLHCVLEGLGRIQFCT